VSTNADIRIPHRESVPRTGLNVSTNAGNFPRNPHPHPEIRVIVSVAEAGVLLASFVE
jgi:hypothetical protein